MSRIDKSNILGCVLAGGLSRRMGGFDKAIADFGGRTLAAHVAERLAGQVAATIINANGDTARFKALGLPIVSDTIEGYMGPLAGILAAMRYAQARYPGLSHLVSVATDTPFFPLDLASRLARSSSEPDTIVLAASGDHVHSVVGLWPVSLADELDAWLRTAKRRSVRAWTESRSAVAVTFDPVTIGAARVDPFLNLNTPEDLESARLLLPQRA